MISHLAQAQTRFSSAPQLQKIAASEIDGAALLLGDPARGATAFGRNINSTSFQDGLLSFAGWQYAIYYNGARQLCLARRSLPSAQTLAGEWQIIHFSGYEFKTNDAHNIASLGICARDGSLHLAYDGHGIAPTFFRISKPGIALHPGQFAWNENLFAPQRDGIQDGITLKSITYPRFVSAPGGGLQATYRTGGSGIGELWMVDYNPATEKWENTRQIDNRAGTWSDPDGSTGGSPNGSPVSATRCSYHNEFLYDSSGKLHITWVWRETIQGANHDICYGNSDDRGFTWKNNVGEIIGRAAPGKKDALMSIDSPGLVVVPVSRAQGMINSQAQAIDSRDRVHLMMSHVTPESVRAVGFPYPSKATWGAPAALRYHHYTRENDGKWKHFELPMIAGGRGWLGFNASDTAYFVYLGRPEPVSKLDESEIYFDGSLCVAMASAGANYTDWHLAYQENGPFVSEFRPDATRLKNEGVLSIQTQCAAPTSVFSSPLAVVDLAHKP